MHGEFVWLSIEGESTQIRVREYKYKYIVADADSVLKSRRPWPLDILACGPPALGTELQLASKPTHHGPCGRPVLLDLKTTRGKGDTVVVI